MVAIANAGGTPSNAGGSIVALNQPITASDSLDGASEQLSGLVQVNVSIQPGDSGGSLVNTAGQVIGIDTAASQSHSSQGSGTEGFAIPVDQALAVARQIESGQGSTTVHVGSTAFLGVLLSASSAQSGPDNLFGNGTGSSGGSSPSGPTVSSVVSGGPAAQAGLAAGDVITSLAGRSVDSHHDQQPAGRLPPQRQSPDRVAPACSSQRYRGHRRRWPRWSRFGWTLVETSGFRNLSARFARRIRSQPR